MHSPVFSLFFFCFLVFLLFSSAAAQGGPGLAKLKEIIKTTNNQQNSQIDKQTQQRTPDASILSDSLKKGDILAQWRDVAGGSQGKNSYNQATPIITNSIETPVVLPPPQPQISQLINSPVGDFHQLRQRLAAAAPQAAQLSAQQGKSGLEEENENPLENGETSKTIITDAKPVEVAKNIPVEPAKIDEPPAEDKTTISKESPAQENSKVQEDEEEEEESTDPTVVAPKPTPSAPSAQAKTTEETTEGQPEQQKPEPLAGEDDDDNEEDKNSLALPAPPANSPQQVATKVDPLGQSTTDIETPVDPSPTQGDDQAEEGTEKIPLKTPEDAPKPQNPAADQKPVDDDSNGSNPPVMPEKPAEESDASDADDLSSSSKVPVPPPAPLPACPIDFTLGDSVSSDFLTLHIVQSIFLNDKRCDRSRGWTLYYSVDADFPAALTATAALDFPEADNEIDWTSPRLLPGIVYNFRALPAGQDSNALSSLPSHFAIPRNSANLPTVDKEHAAAVRRLPAEDLAFRISLKADQAILKDETSLPLLGKVLARVMNVAPERLIDLTINDDEAGAPFREFSFTLLPLLTADAALEHASYEAAEILRLALLDAEFSLKHPNQAISAGRQQLPSTIRGKLKFSAERILIFVQCPIDANPTVRKDGIFNDKVCQERSPVEQPSPKQEQPVETEDDKEEEEEKGQDQDDAEAKDSSVNMPPSRTFSDVCDPSQASLSYLSDPFRLVVSLSEDSLESCERPAFLYLEWSIEPAFGTPELISGALASFPVSSNNIFLPVEWNFLSGVSYFFRVRSLLTSTSTPGAAFQTVPAEFLVPVPIAPEAAPELDSIAFQFLLQTPGLRSTLQLKYEARHALGLAVSQVDSAELKILADGTKRTSLAILPHADSERGHVEAAEFLRLYLLSRASGPSEPELRLIFPKSKISFSATLIGESIETLIRCSEEADFTSMPCEKVAPPEEDDDDDDEEEEVVEEATAEEAEDDATEDEPVEEAAEAERDEDSEPQEVDDEDQNSQNDQNDREVQQEEVEEDSPQPPVAPRVDREEEDSSISSVSRLVDSDDSSSFLSHPLALACLFAVLISGSYFYFIRRSGGLGPRNPPAQPEELDRLERGKEFQPIAQEAPEDSAAQGDERSGEESAIHFVENVLAGIGLPLYGTQKYTAVLRENYLTRLEQIESLDSSDWRRLNLPLVIEETIRTALKQRGAQPTEEKKKSLGLSLKSAAAPPKRAETGKNAAKAPAQQKRLIAPVVASESDENELMDRGSWSDLDDLEQATKTKEGGEEATGSWPEMDF